MGTETAFFVHSEIVLFFAQPLVEPKAQVFSDSDPSSFNILNSIGLGQLLGFSDGMVNTRKRRTCVAHSASPFALSSVFGEAQPLNSGPKLPLRCILW